MIFRQIVQRFLSKQRMHKTAMQNATSMSSGMELYLDKYQKRICTLTAYLDLIEWYAEPMQPPNLSALNRMHLGFWNGAIRPETECRKVWVVHENRVVVGFCVATVSEFIVIEAFMAGGAPISLFAGVLEFAVVKKLCINTPKIIDSMEPFAWRKMLSVPKSAFEKIQQARVTGLKAGEPALMSTWIDPAEVFAAFGGDVVSEEKGVLTTHCGPVCVILFAKKKIVAEFVLTGRTTVLHVFDRMHVIGRANARVKRVTSFPKMPLTISF